MISVVANFVLLFAYSTISPEPKREAFFVDAQSGKPQEFYVLRTNSPEFEIKQGSIGYNIAEAYIVDYIVNRESVFSDSVIMQKMWGFRGPVYYYSTRNVYNAFVRSSEYRDALVNLDKYIVSVDVEKPQYQPESKNWIVDVNVKTTNRIGLNPIMTKKKIRIKAEFLHDDKKLNNANMWENPLGFKITSYEYIRS